MKNMNFTVYKSSAGSGKTYTLVREYLKMVLTKPDDFRHVLAITFTNKAANEMKERIISTLKNLSTYNSGKSSDSLLNLVSGLEKETGLDLAELILNSNQVLNLILHNYTDFAVSTIDSFIHRIIKSFAFDLNIPINFEVELDTDEVLKQVVDVLISRAGTEKELTRFLIDFVQNRADEERNWNIESDLYKIARLLTKEDSAEHLKKNIHLDLHDYVKINNTIYRYIKLFESEVQELGQQGSDIIGSGGIPTSSFYQGSRGIVGYFNFLANKKFDKLIPNKTVQKAMEEDKWFSGKATENDMTDIQAIKSDLVRIYEKIQHRILHDHQIYTLFVEIRRNLYPLAILDKINQILEEFKSENNILLISEFNKLISEIVLEEPVPFIYERVGEKYKHFLLDEFQDTSVLQWQNLLPLIDNSLANGYKNLLVGDAKQAIYRWRNGEVEQFVNLPQIHNRKSGQIHDEREKALQNHFIGKSLNSNYRSRPEIVKFNNEFFNHIKQYLSEKDNKIYDEVKQDVASDKKGGYIQIEFFPPNMNDITFSAYNCNRVNSLIAEIQTNGYQLKDIAILCRSNKSAGIIAKFLLSQNIDVVSSESVLLVNSLKIRLIVCVLSLISNPGNELAALEMVNLLIKMEMIAGDLHATAAQFAKRSRDYFSHDQHGNVFDFLKNAGFIVNRKTLLSLPLYDLCESLVRTFNFNKQSDPFVQFFLDVALEQEKETESDLIRFLDYWNTKKNKLSVVIPDGIDAVKIMTIHKAKGLEFPVVIYPLINERLKKTIDMFWLSLNNETIPTLKAALVNANRSLEETTYGGLITREYEKSQLDMINLLYVAFTRPTDHLYVIANHPGKSYKAASSVSSLLVDFLEHSGKWNDEEYIYNFGEKTIPSYAESLIYSSFDLKSFISQDWRKRAFLSYQAPANWEVEEPVKHQEWGNLIHEILAEIKTHEELNLVLEEYLFQGIIDPKERKILEDVIHEFLVRPEVVRYFKPGLTVLTESEIITHGGMLFRPDRIVMDDNQVFVIDFKTGIPLEKHKSQMNGYLDVIRQMNLPNPKGVILYLSQQDPVYIG